jgi:competence protein ComFC
MEITQTFWDLLYPTQCQVCDSSFIDVSESRKGLCIDCESYLSIDTSIRCRECGRPLSSEHELCLDCRKQEQRICDGAYAIYQYSKDVKQLIKAYKFGYGRPLSVFFAAKLLEVSSQMKDQWGSWDAWVPVPARLGKKKEKGWDQLDLLAQKLHKNFGQTVEFCLKRGHSRAQKELNRQERLINLENKITCIKKPPERVILFDDVMTTGATIRACTSALKAAGTKKVFAMVLCFD